MRPTQHLLLFKQNQIAHKTYSQYKSLPGLSGFVDGWAMSRRCFHRQSGFTGNSFGAYTAVIYTTLADLMGALLNGQVIMIM